MLDWAMATVAGKKKVAMHKITVLDFVPYVIVPSNGQSFVGPLVTQEPQNLRHNPKSLK